MGISLLTFLPCPCAHIILLQPTPVISDTNSRLETLPELVLLVTGLVLFILVVRLLYFLRNTNSTESDNVCLHYVQNLYIVGYLIFLLMVKLHMVVQCLSLQPTTVVIWALN